jgi:hypothetical protein
MIVLVTLVSLVLLVLPVVCVRDGLDGARHGFVSAWRVSDRARVGACVSPSFVDF